MYKVGLVIFLTIAAMICGAVASTVFARLSLTFPAQQQLTVNRLVKSDRLAALLFVQMVERSRKADRLQTASTGLARSEPARRSLRLAAAGPASGAAWPLADSIAKLVQLLQAAAPVEKIDRVADVPASKTLKIDRKVDFPPSTRPAKSKSRYFVPTKFTDPDGIVTAGNAGTVHIAPAAATPGKTSNVSAEAVELQRWN